MAWHGPDWRNGTDSGRSERWFDSEAQAGRAGAPARVTPPSGCRAGRPTDLKHERIRSRCPEPKWFPRRNATPCSEPSKTASTRTCTAMLVSIGLPSRHASKRTAPVSRRSMRWNNPAANRMWLAWINRPVPVSSRIAQPRARKSAGACATIAKPWRDGRNTNPGPALLRWPPLWVPHSSRSRSIRDSRPWASFSAARLVPHIPRNGPP
jgi:hypothetical protein